MAILVPLFYDKLAPGEKPLPFGLLVVSVYLQEIIVHCLYRTTYILFS